MTTGLAVSIGLQYQGATDRRTDRQNAGPKQIADCVSLSSRDKNAASHGAGACALVAISVYCIPAECEQSGRNHAHFHCLSLTHLCCDQLASFIFCRPSADLPASIL